MARKTGDRNRDFEQKRSRILDALERRVLKEDAARLTMNELANAADVSVSSLRHHLGSRSEVLAAVIERLGDKGSPFLAAMTAPTTLELRASLHMAVHMVAQGLVHGVSEIVGLGLAVGMRDPVVGPAFLDSVLEPMLQSVEQRLQQHVQRGDLPPCDVRIAALSLVSPLVLAALHQRCLGGDGLRPLRLEAVADELVERFLRAYTS
jgi:AcrR family transcriptional regulator